MQALLPYAAPDPVADAHFLAVMRLCAALLVAAFVLWIVELRRRARRGGDS